MNPETIVVLPELKAYIDPLTPDEHDALERSILAELGWTAEQIDALQAPQAI